MQRIALIFGISGQDGSYLARFLLDRGYTVHGTSRDVAQSSFLTLQTLGIRERVHLHTASLLDFSSVARIIRDVAPTEIYNLSAQSAVGLSFEQPIETIDSILGTTLNVLEAVRLLGVKTRVFHASSSESFGNTLDGPANESTPFRPCSPYGVAKASAHWMVANYRQAYGLHASSGILFNHESPLRPPRFVTRKIIRGAVAIAQGRTEPLELGNLKVERDWGWAPEYVDAMWRMLQQDEPDDFIIATGQTHALEDFVRLAFAHFGLDWRDYVIQADAHRRPLDVYCSSADPRKAREKLGWVPQTMMPGLITRLIEAEMAAQPSAAPSAEG